MKSFYWIVLSNLFIVSHVYSQTALYQNNIGICITRGSTIYISGNYQTNTNVNNAGVITVTGDLINTGSTGIFENQTGALVLTGSSDQQFQSSGTWQFNELAISKPSGSVLLNCDIQVDSLLTFNGGDLMIDAHQIDLGVSGSLHGESENSRIYATTGTVKAKRLLASPLSTEDIAGTGFYVHAPIQNYGMTEITRGHNSISEVGSGSISRWFYIKPSVAAPSESISIHYFDTDGIADESLLQFYSKKPTTTMYFPNGGAANAVTNQAASTYFSTLEEELITLAPISDNSTCDPTNPNYVEAIFLVPTNVTEDDTVYFVNLSTPAPDSIRSIWNAGDGFTFNTEDVWHPYADPGNYNASLSVSNAVCSDANTKVIVVKENTIRRANSPVVSELINSFIFYPNPVETNLNWYLDLTDLYPSSIMLLDVYERTIFQKQYYQKSIEDSKDFSALPQGLYLLKLEVMGRVYTYRIVKL